MAYSPETWRVDPDEVAQAHQHGRRMLRSVQNIVLATTNSDGTPHTTILAQNFHIIRDREATARRLCLLAWSFPVTQHAQNMRRNPERPVRVQLLHSNVGYGALALHGVGGRLEMPDIEQVLPAFNARRNLFGLSKRELAEFTDAAAYPKDLLRVDFTEAELPVRAIDPAGEHAADGAWVMSIPALLDTVSPPPGTLRVGEG